MCPEFKYFQGLCNGTRLVVRKFKDHVIYCEIITGPHKGEHVLLPRITLTPNEEEIPFELKRQQFPIKLAFCLTINKAQGQTFKKLDFMPKNHYFIMDNFIQFYHELLIKII